MAGKEKNKKKNEKFTSAKYHIEQNEIYFDIEFSKTILYWVGKCTSNSYQPFTTTPSEQEKIWTITKTSTNLIVHCNGVEVLDFEFASSSRSECVEKWSTDVSKVAFWDDGGDERDTASDEYRMKPTTCDSLPDVAHLEIKTGSLPAHYKDSVTVQCSSGFTLRGDTTIICYPERRFDGTVSCEESEDIPYFHYQP